MKPYAYLLQPNGAHIDVDDSNLEEYLERVLDMTLGSGIAAQVTAFQEGACEDSSGGEKKLKVKPGFSMIFPVRNLRIFPPEELGLLFGNAKEDWSREGTYNLLNGMAG